MRTQVVLRIIKCDRCEEKFEFPVKESGIAVEHADAETLKSWGVVTFANAPLGGPADLCPKCVVAFHSFMKPENPHWPIKISEQGIKERSDEIEEEMERIERGNKKQHVAPGDE